MLITGIIGYPLETTLSPKMHNATFKELGMDGIYLRFPVKEEKLKEATLGLRALGFRGVNITVPYKEKVMEYLDEIPEEVREIGAVNTILIKDDKLIGHNTDKDGFRESLIEYRIDIIDKNILLIGAGGAGRACAYIINSMKPMEFIITDKISERAKILSHLYDAEVIGIDKIENIILKTDIVINATPVDFQEMILPIMKQGATYYDLNYKFKVQRKSGAKVINGLLMLIHQGARSFNLWTQREPPIEIMKKAAEGKYD